MVYLYTIHNLLPYANWIGLESCIFGDGCLYFIGLQQFWTGGFHANLVHPLNENWFWNDYHVDRPIHFQHWCPGEPDNRNNGNEHFLAMIRDCWHDVPGHFNWSPICQRKGNILDPRLLPESHFTFNLGSNSIVIPCRPIIGDTSIDIWMRGSTAYHYQNKVIRLVDVLNWIR